MNSQILDRRQASLPADMNLAIPPKWFVDMQGERSGRQIVALCDTTFATTHSVP
jgi:hypothetical protein